MTGKGRFVDDYRRLTLTTTAWLITRHGCWLAAVVFHWIRTCPSTRWSRGLWSLYHASPASTGTTISYL
jgi:hypothetical protein